MMNIKELRTSKYFFWIILSCWAFTKLEGQIYSTADFKVDLPTDWICKPLARGLRSYNHLSKDGFISIDIIYAYIHADSLEEVMSNFNHPQVKESFKNHLIASYKEKFDPIKFQSSKILELAGRSWLSIKWKGISKKEFLMLHNKGQETFVIQYFTPSSNDPHRSFVITAIMLKPDQESELMVQEIVKTFSTF